MKKLLLVVLPLSLLLMGCSKEEDKALEVLRLKAKIENLTNECNILKLEMQKLEESLKYASGSKADAIREEMDNNTRERNRKEREIEELQKQVDELLAYSSPRLPIYSLNSIS